MCGFMSLWYVVMELASRYDSREWRVCVGNVFDAVVLMLLNYPYKEGGILNQGLWKSESHSSKLLLGYRFFYRRR